MGAIIDLLEKIGSDARLRETGFPDLDRRLSLLKDVGPYILSAIASADRTEIARLLGHNGKVCCLIAPAMDDEEDEDARTKRECDDEGAEEQPIPVCDPAKVASAA